MFVTYLKMFEVRADARLPVGCFLGTHTGLDWTIGDLGSLSLLTIIIIMRMILIMIMMMMMVMMMMMIILTVTTTLMMMMITMIMMMMMMMILSTVRTTTLMMMILMMITFKVATDTSAHTCKSLQPAHRVLRFK